MLGRVGASEPRQFPLRHGSRPTPRACRLASLPSPLSASVPPVQLLKPSADATALKKKMAAAEAKLQRGQRDDGASERKPVRALPSCGRPPPRRDSRAAGRCGSEGGDEAPPGADGRGGRARPSAAGGGGAGRAAATIAARAARGRRQAGRQGKAPVRAASAADGRDGAGRVCAVSHCRRRVAGRRGAAKHPVPLCARPTPLPQASEVAAGLCAYFNAACAPLLLYGSERGQLAELSVRRRNHDGRTRGG